MSMTKYIVEKCVRSSIPYREIQTPSWRGGFEILSYKSRKRRLCYAAIVFDDEWISIDTPIEFSSISHTYIIEILDKGFILIGSDRFRIEKKIVRIRTSADRILCIERSFQDELRIHIQFAIFHFCTPHNSFCEYECLHICDGVTDDNISSNIIFSFEDDDSFRCRNIGIEDDISSIDYERIK